MLELGRGGISPVGSLNSSTYPLAIYLLLKEIFLKRGQDAKKLKKIPRPKERSWYSSSTKSERFSQGPWLDNEVRIRGDSLEHRLSLTRELQDIISNGLPFGKPTGSRHVSSLNLRSDRRGAG